MNLFVAAMLLLVLADDLLVLFIGWEGVGLCSYLLIGFWYRDEWAILASRKAFTMTRIGDAALLLGIILCATRLGSLRIEEILSAAGRTWHSGGALPLAASCCFFWERSASRPSCRCKPGFPMPWPDRPR